MSYPIVQKFIKYNRPRVFLGPQGVVIHSTANPGATAENHYKYFNSDERKASAHFFVDWKEIIQTIPEDERAYHAGPSANERYLSIEICEGETEEEFRKTWDAAVWLTAKLCKKYNWEIGSGVLSHRYVSGIYKETDHIDPYPYFNKYGRTWIDFTQAVKEELRGGKKVKNLIIYQPGDYAAALLLRDHVRCPILDMNNVTAETLQASERIFQLGGQKVDPKVELIAGKNRFETAQLVLDKIKGGI